MHAEKENLSNIILYVSLFSTIFYVISKMNSRFDVFHIRLLFFLHIFLQFFNE